MQYALMIYAEPGYAEAAEQMTVTGSYGLF